MKSKLGKKVWLFDENNKLDKTKIWEVKSIIPCDGITNKDWCNHYLVSNNGVEKEIREYNAIFTPNQKLQEADKVNHYLADNDLFCDDVSQYNGIVRVSLHWQDWKHGHLWCTNLMGFIGYKEIDEEVTEDNGSDCYSADHIYASVEKLVI